MGAAIKSQRGTIVGADIVLFWYVGLSVGSRIELVRSGELFDTTNYAACRVATLVELRRFSVVEGG